MLANIGTMQINDSSCKKLGNETDSAKTFKDFIESKC